MMQLAGNQTVERSVGTILVTGAAGYIGGALLDHLAGCHEHPSVRALDAFLYGNPPADTSQSDAVHIKWGDIRDRATVREAMTGIDSVVHLAAIVGDPACVLLPDLAQAVNVDATALLLESARAAGVRRFVFASTCSVYGAAGTEITEESPLNPVSLYARTKIEAERLVLAADSAEMRTVVLRFATLYGLAPRLRFDLIANLLAARAARGLPITIHGGQKWRPFLHVADAAAAIDHVLAANDPLAGIFNVGAPGENYQLADLRRFIESLVPGTDLAISDDPTDYRSYHVNADRFAATGFRPRWTLTAGLREMIDYLHQRPEIAIDDPHWSNIAWLQKSHHA
jgi:nucleoside-diphosphate-sugar epimerase